MDTTEVLQPEVVSEAPKNAMVRVRDILDRNSKAIQQAIPPMMRHLTAQRIISIAMTTLATNPYLQDSDPFSIAVAVKESAALGLQLDGVLGHAYLVPYNTKDGNAWVKKAKLQVGYKGLTTMALRNHSTQFVTSEVVYDCDSFKFQLGTKPYLTHRPADVRPIEAKRSHAWASLTFKSGQVKFIVMSAQDVTKIKEAVLSRQKGRETPWTGAREVEDEMWKKTALRRLLKTAPMEESYAVAISRDELREQGVETDEERLMELAETREMVINADKPEKKGGLYDDIDVAIANRIYNAGRRYNKKMTDDQIESSARLKKETTPDMTWGDIAAEMEELARLAEEERKRK